MAEETGIQKIVATVVAQVLDSYVPKIREDIVQRVLQELPAQLPGAAPAVSTADTAGLLKGVANIQAGATQKEILRALLDNTEAYAGRAALFVVKASSATGWQGRGFANSDEVKDYALDATGGVAFEALHSRTAARGRSEEMDPQFLSRFGVPDDDRVLLLPLLLKDKVAALVYCDPGPHGLLDSPSLEILVRATSAWLEVASLRKQSPKESPVESADAGSAPVPVQTVSSFSDPFASHSPKHAAPPVAEPVVAQSAMAASAAAAASPAPQLSPEDAETHRKAQRFARLLMDEIKLYNQAKVAEGRKNRDLYDRLKDDIEKSRATYQKRYGNTVASNTDYFSHEVVRSLAEDDVSLMGANFRG